MNDQDGVIISVEDQHDKYLSQAAKVRARKEAIQVNDLVYFYHSEGSRRGDVMRVLAITETPLASIYTLKDSYNNTYYATLECIDATSRNRVSEEKAKNANT